MLIEGLNRANIGIAQNHMGSGGRVQHTAMDRQRMLLQELLASDPSGLSLLAAQQQRSAVGGAPWNAPPALSFGGAAQGLLNHQQQQQQRPSDLAQYLQLQQAMNQLPLQGHGLGASPMGLQGYGMSPTSMSSLMERRQQIMSAAGMGATAPYRSGMPGMPPYAGLAQQGIPVPVMRAALGGSASLDLRDMYAAAGLSNGLQSLNNQNFAMAQQARGAAMTNNAGSIAMRLPVVLALQEDNEKLSSHQVQLRLQIEAFQATDDDVTTHTRGRNKPIAIGQVGIRCRHCSHLPVCRRQKGSTYFPATLLGLYQAAQNMSTTHMQCGLCTEMPDDVKQQFVTLLSTKPASSGAGRPYWAHSARKLGLVDTEDGIRFIRDLPAGVRILQE